MGRKTAMTEKYNEALSEQVKKNVWESVKDSAANMSTAERAELVADVAGIFDPTPISDAAGLGLALVRGDGMGALMSLGSMVPYLGDAVAKPAKLLKRAPKVAHAVEAMFKAGDNLAKAGKDTLKAAGLSLEQVAAARKKALEKVQQAMLDAKKRVANCERCKLVGEAGEKRQLQMPQSGRNGKWDTPGGTQPESGNGMFGFAEKKTLPDGRQVDGIEFKDGAPDFSPYVQGGKHQLWEVSGDASVDANRLEGMMKEANPGWNPPNADQYVLHHFEDGSVGYVPRVLHDKKLGGVGHTGGNSMVNNQLF
jgi:hypothetical protein